MGKTYSEDKIKHYYDSEFNFTSKIWSMLDFDLITHDINEKEYTIANEKTCEEFLNKYYIEKKEKPIELTSLTKQEQMNIVINTISEGKTNEEAAKLAGIPTYKIIHWKNEGKQGNGKDNIEFYKRYEEALKTVNANEEKIKELVILLLTECETIEKAARFIENGKYEEKIKEWYILGKQNDKRHAEFYNECIELINLDTTTPIKKEDITPNIKKEDINILSIKTKSKPTDVIIKGTIKNTELINLLNYLKEFEKNINKLISTNNKKYTDIFIEMKLEDSELEILTDKLNKLD